MGFSVEIARGRGDDGRKFPVSCRNDVYPKGLSQDPTKKAEAKAPGTQEGLRQCPAVEAATSLVTLCACSVHSAE